MLREQSFSNLKQSAELYAGSRDPTQRIASETFAAHVFC